jgi:putative transposase
VLIEKHIGCARFVYNWGLAKKIEYYQQNKEKLSCFTLMKELTKLKKEEKFEWLGEVNSQSLQVSLRNLDDAFTKFFREKKGFPKFHKKTGKKSFQIPQHIKIDFENNVIQLPKINKVKINIHRKFDGKIKTCTISKNSINQYFISILIDNNIELPQKAQIIEKTAIGIDLGVKDFAILSDGKKISNPKNTNKYAKKLSKHQRRLARKKLKSKRRELQKKRVAKIHLKIINSRKDFLHKLSSDIVKNYDTVITENLNVKGMVKNHNLAKSINDCGWGTFTSMLEYKCNWYGKNFIKIGRFEPSSKICNVCGIINQELTLKDREWTCNNCGTMHDRDINASINIKKFGLQKQNLIQIEVANIKNTPQELGEELVELSAKAGAMKREAQSSLAVG